MRNLLRELNIEVHLAHKIHGATVENHHIPWRRLYDYEMIFVVEGEIIVKTKNKTYTVKENEIHVMPPFLYHTRIIPRDKTCTYYGLHLDFFRVNDREFSIHDAYVAPIEKREDVVSSENKDWLKRKRFSGINVLPHFAVQDAQTLKKLFSKACRINKKQADDPYFQIALNACAYEIVHAVLLECMRVGATLFTPSKNLHEDLIADFIENVENEYMNEINVDELVAGYGLSKNHFAKVFKKATNVAPHDYLIDFRIEKAKTLLQEGKYYVNEIAEMVGYPDYAYFSRIFKKKEGVSPKNYLKQHKQA